MPQRKNPLEVHPVTATPKNLEITTDGSTVEPVLIHGRVRHVDSESCVADFDWLGGQRLLRFPPDLGQKVDELKNRFVEVQGLGSYEASGRLIEIELTDIHHESDEIDQLLADDQWQQFDPAKVVRAEEPIDVDDFLRGIYEARRVGGCSCTEQ